ncbi:MAG: hypothetical protein ACQEXJ_09040 [Myxococcota bacterium]
MHLQISNTPLRNLGAGLVLLAGLLVGCDDGSEIGSGGPDTTQAIDTAGDDGPTGDEGSGETVEPDADATTAPDDDAGPTPDADADDGEEDVVLLECPDDVDCDDGLACTDDGCSMPGYVCTWELQPGSCLIGGTCRADGEAHPDDPCRVCDPDADPYAWTPLEDGTSCDDGEPCTEQSTCQGGICQGAPNCSDNNPCTKDECDPETGCEHTPLAQGTPCDDGDMCTDMDTCQMGECTGTPTDCDDGNPCTDDACDPTLGCTSTDNEASCEDGDLCTDGDTCVEGTCEPGEETVCDDGNACTADTCDPNVGCVHLPMESPCCVGETSICDDDDPCTTDLCDPATGGCSHEFNTAPCDDQDACTTGDTCDAGECVGEPVSCDDGNPCTQDQCNASEGCVNVPLDGDACDDGLACSTNDVCVDGVCQGDESECTCTPTFSADAAKADSVLIGDGGHPGEGLDLDDDPETCAPSTDCSGGINNGLGILAGMANDSLVDAVDDGSVMILLEFRDLKQGSFTMAAYQADLDPANADCDFQNATCAYLVDPSLLDEETCEPMAALPGTLDGDTIAAGGPESVFPFALPLTDGVELQLTIFNVRFEGTATLTDGQVTGVDGILGGAVPKETLLAAVDALPDDGDVPKDLVKAFIDGLEADIDGDGDGTKESVSLGLKVHAIDATIAGMQE